MAAFSKQRTNMAPEDDNEDDEISIDFGKITKIFKRKEKEVPKEIKKEEKSEDQRSESENDDEIDIDFSKIRNIFKRKKPKEEIKNDEKEVKKEIKIDDRKEENTEKNGIKKDLEQKKLETKEEEDEEFSIDFGKLKGIFKRKKTAEEKETEKEESKDIKNGESEDDNDEINIDFSKIKDIFKRKDKKEKSKELKEEQIKDKGDEDEISLDFDKIKSFFRKKKEPEEESEKEDKEEIINISDLSAFYNKYKHIIIPLIIILFAMSLSIYLRVQPAYLPATDDWATNSVHNYFRSQIKAQIDQQYPNLPEANKNVLVDTEFQKLLEQQKPQIKEQIKQTSAYFKSRLQNDKGQTYLLAIDPYFWLLKAKNVIEHGYPADTIKKKGEIDPYTNSPFKKDVLWDNHMLAPYGRGETPDLFHPYFEAYLYKSLNIFNRDLELMKVAFYVPVIISALAVIPAFFIARKFGGNFAGFIASVFIAIHVSFLNRTAGGFSDTDAYNVFFPLFILWVYFASLESENMFRRIGFAASSGLLAGVYSFAWGGWWYIFDFIIAASLIYLVYSLLVNIRDVKKYLSKQETRNILIIMFIFIVFSAIFVTIFRGYATFRGAWYDPFSFTQIKEVAVQKIWPNVFTTVAEQNEAPLSGIISNIGGKFLFFISLIGIILVMAGEGSKKTYYTWFIILSIIWMYLTLSIAGESINIFFILMLLPVIAGFIIFLKEDHKKENIKIAILLVIWYLSTIYASTKGIRWVLLLVPAFSIAFSIALGKIYQYLSSTAIKELGINKVIAKSVIIILLCLLLVGPWNAAKSVAKQGIPSMNDAWWNSLEKIKLESKPDAIINSWWDFGHWFKTIADRQVTFDGTSQDSAQAHWIGNVLLTSDEDTAIGILRMLDCGANEAFNELDKKINDAARSIEILYEIIVKDKNEAKSILLSHNLIEKEADMVLTKTHCEPPEDYFIASEDMVSKSGVWAHFGSWDFNKAQIYFTLNKNEYKNNKEASIKYLKERFGYSEDEADNIYYEVKSLTSSSDVNNWIAPWPSYGGSGSCDKQDEYNLICSNGIQVDLKSNEAFAITQTQEKLYSKSFAIPAKDGNLIIKERNESLLTLQNGRPFGVVLIPEGDSYSILVMDYALTGSMFTRLFYMDGHGLQHFKEFSDERSVFGGRIIVYKIDWDGNKKNIMDHFKAVEEKERHAEEEKIKAAINQSKISLLNESDKAPSDISNESQ